MAFTDRFPVPQDRQPAVAREFAKMVERWADQEVIAQRPGTSNDLAGLLTKARSSLMNEVGLGQLVPLLAGDEDSAGALAVSVVAALEQVARADTSLAFCAANAIVLQVAASRDRVPAAARKALLGSLSPLASLVLPGLRTTGETASLDGLTTSVRVTRRGRRFVLQGSGARPQFGEAELFGVVVTLDLGEPALLLVAADQAGLKRGEPRLTTGLVYPGHADLDFEDVSLLPSALLFRGEAPYRLLGSWYALTLAAAAVGSAAAAWAILDDWSRSRVIKGRGQVFKDNSLVASVLGEIGGSIGSARLLTYALAGLLDGRADASGNYAVVASSAAEVQANVMHVLDRGMELMGSAGYAREWNLERHWRDVRTLQNCAWPVTVTGSAMARHAFGSEVV